MKARLNKKFILEYSIRAIIQRVGKSKKQQKLYHLKHTVADIVIHQFQILPQNQIRKIEIIIKSLKLI